MDPDIPWDQEVNLRNLISAPAVAEIRHKWQEFGIHLGVADSDIRAIEVDKRGQVIDCTRELLSTRMKNDLPLTWEMIRDATQKVKKKIAEDDKLYEDKEKIENEQRAVLAAIRKLKSSMDELDERNQDIAENIKRLTLQLNKEKGSLPPLKILWKKEDDQWGRGEGWRQQMRQAIGERNFQQSRFVQDFLQSKSLQDDLSDDEVEGYLRNYLLEEDKARSQQLRLRYEKIRLHQRNLNEILESITKWKALVGDHLHRAYARIVKSLEEIGLNTEKIQDLKDKLQKLNDILYDCKQGVIECNQEITAGNNELKEFRNELNSFIVPFRCVIHGMHSIITSLESTEKDLSKEREGLVDYLKQAMATLMGGVIGTLILPGFGTMMGATVAYNIFRRSVVGSQKAKLKDIEDKLSTKRRTLRVLRTTEHKGKTELDELNKLVHLFE